MTAPIGKKGITQRHTLENFPGTMCHITQAGKICLSRKDQVTYIYSFLGTSFNLGHIAFQVSRKKTINYSHLQVCPLHAPF